MGWKAAHFHAGLKPELKKTTQQQFISGELRVIVATNAFGMGIDKPDVRLVVHAEIPGSLENYVQEAGRAGRDQQAARCVLLYCEQDIERQFGLSAYSRLPHHEIQAVLRALRRLAGKRRPPDEHVEVVATPGEILSEDEESDFLRDSNTDDIRVRTAVSCLERARLVSREENHYQVFPSTLRLPDLKEADARLAEIPMPYRGQLRAIVELLMLADPTEGVTTDELMGASRLSSSGVARAMHDLERCGIITNDSIFTALVHIGVENASRKRMESAVAMETALTRVLQEVAPDLEKGSSSVLHLRRVSQHLKDAGYTQALPERIQRLLLGLESDGRSDNQGLGSIRLRKIDAESVLLTLQRDWGRLQDTTELRRSAARLLLNHLLSRVPPDSRGNDLLAKTTLGNLNAAVESDLAVSAQVKDVCKLVERALLWLHEQEIVRLGKGLVVLRPAMSIRVAPGNSPFTRNHYAELQDHYNEQIVQIHVMAEYARQGLQAARDAMRLVGDYFTLDREAFIRNWFPQAAKNLSRQTGDESWRAIVESLNPVQRRIVTDERDQTNVLVLAGPGSGKTRVLVHRIAFLVRVRRENPRGILALAYNRHAVVEIRRRLSDLIGDDANGVTVLTCHALAMRLTGASFAERSAQDMDFKQVLADAVQLLLGDGLLADDVDEQRERLLAGFRWILVDEYQDIGSEQYELISALAGRTLNDPERKLSLFAVGDDDQNVYGFAGASVEYIRRFQQDYKAKPEYLVSNYRSTANIIETSNALISQAQNRMKTGHPIEIDELRRTTLRVASGKCATRWAKDALKS
jgi:ATP-dependent DNA helicase RecQ